MALSIKNLTVNIKTKKILNGVSFEVKPSEIHAIMGPNGSGKSTLANVLAGNPTYQHTSRSLVQLDNTDLFHLSPDERSQQGLFLAFQYPVEVPGVSVERFLREAYRARNQQLQQKDFTALEFRKHLQTLVKELAVNPELLKRGLNEGFSGGEKKRLEILQMAVLQPKYAILDETDSGLDIDAIKAVAGGVKTIVNKFKTGIIIITHYQRILQYVKPDVVHVMKDGTITESGGYEIVKRLEETGYGVDK